ncbi:MAG: tRNA 2-thiocytidine(32) synthetase TtcA [Clostridia bacterium]|nr:tRNA 2-thiocytidine(32) synthetase TtcA [Clostridia bacterium]
MFIIKQILGYVRRAVQDYDMIQEGDRIAVGVSGGKDSLTLLVALRRLQHFFPIKYELEAVTLTMGIGEFNTAPIRELCSEIGVNYTVEETLIGKIIFEARQEKNPCSLCANMRRGALHNVAKRLGCNKVALGHHKDDAIETLMLSLLYEGRISTFSPVTFLDRKELHLIRPLIYAQEKEIKGFIKSEGIRTVKSACHIDGKTKRQYIKDLLRELSIENRDVKNNIFGAIQRSHISHW